MGLQMNNLHIDLETFSTVDLNKSGVYRYAEDPEFSILLFGVAVDDGAVRVYDLAQGEELPQAIVDALLDPLVLKYAHNAAFERICLSRFLWDCQLLPKGEYLDSVSWRCTMVWSAYAGLPLSLKAVGQALELTDGKMDEGKGLIKLFCQPCKPTSMNGGKERFFPSDAPEKWELFKAYNKRDVEVEMEIARRLATVPVPESVWEEYRDSEQINDRGILVDMDMVHKAIALDEQSQVELVEGLRELTDLDNPRSVTQMKEWLQQNGLELGSLGKKEVAAVLHTAPEPLRTVLLLRQEVAKSSVKKYVAMENAVCADGRLRGMFVFYGATRSGRFSGRIVQLQNLYRNSLPDLEDARALVKTGDYDALEILYDSVPLCLAEVTRTSFIASPGNHFIVCDYSAIEARVLAWMAGEQWRLDLFERGGDIYCQSASQMFHVPVVKHGINGELRQKGKVAELACIAEGELVKTDLGPIPIEEVDLDMRVWDGQYYVNHGGVVYRGKKEVITYNGLTATPDHLVLVNGRFIPFGEYAGDKAFPAGKCRVYDIRNAGPKHCFWVSGHLVHNCGYGGSVGALKAMGALEMGVKEEELLPLVEAWRNANPHIVQFWWKVDRAVKNTIQDHLPKKVGPLSIASRDGRLSITLPSGRALQYLRPRIGTNRFGGSSITYMGMDTTHHWSEIESYGPKFVENCVAEGTLVITDRGPVPIQEVTTEMLVWDGKEFVAHEGVVFKGIQDTILVDGLRLTPDHRVYTKTGWMEARFANGKLWYDFYPLGERRFIRVDHTPRTLPVYDILNAGLRHRFALWNGSQQCVVSNCTQAISRDLLCHAIHNLRAYGIVAHVHDEVICDVPRDVTVAEVEAIMSQTPPWAEGLVIRGEGYSTPWYCKDA